MIGSLLWDRHMLFTVLPSRIFFWWYYLCIGIPSIKNLYAFDNRFVCSGLPAAKHPTSKPLVIVLSGLFSAPPRLPFAFFSAVFDVWHMLFVSSSLRLCQPASPVRFLALLIPYRTIPCTSLLIVWVKSHLPVAMLQSFLGFLFCHLVLCRLFCSKFQSITDPATGELPLGPSYQLPLYPS